jgi:ssDNA-binding Zn-finger/Zn-ribbon topoisomerase 1
MPGQQTQQTQQMSFEQPAIGKVTGPMFGALPGVTTAKSKNKVVWASFDENDVREVLASTSNKKEPVKSLSSLDTVISHIGEAIIRLASAVGVADDATLSAINFKVQKNKTQSQSTPGGNTNMENIFDTMAQKHRLRKASKLSIDAVFTDHSNRHSIAISTDGTVKASVDNKRVAWDYSLNDAQLEKLSSNDITSVGNDVLDTFVGFVKTAESEGRQVLAYEKPQTEKGVKEEAIDSKRTGTDDDVKENIIEPMRTGVDDKVKEELLQPKRTGVKDKVKEELLQDDAGLYARCGTDDDVKEALLEDIRTGVADKVKEELLEKYRAQETSVTTHEAVASVLGGLGNAVLASKNTPDEIVEAAKNLSSQENFSDLLTLAAIGNNKRVKVAARYAFRNDPIPTLSATAAILNELGKVVVAGISVDDIVEIVREASANTEHSVKVIHMDAKKKMGEDFSFDAYHQHRTANKSDAIRVALASLSGEQDDSTSGVEQVKTALAAMAKTTIAIKVTPKEVLSVLASVDPKQLSRDLAIAREDSEIKARKDLRERVAFFEGANIRIAGEPDIYNTVIGFLADYSAQDKYKTSAMVEAIDRVVNKPRYAEKYVARLAFASIREAEATITEDSSVTRRLQCTLDELGLDAKDENFDEMLKQKVAELFVQRGYPVDPSNFNLTDVVIGADGICSATISTRSTKTFKVDPSESESTVPVDGGPVAFEPEPQPEEAMPSEEGIPMAMSPDAEQAVQDGAMPEPPTIMTAGAIAVRKAKRDNLLRLAQMPGMGGGGMGGAPMGGGGGMGGGGATPDLSGAGDGPGVGALTTPPATDGAGGDLGDLGGGDNPTANKDSMPTPGKQLPWGSVCPACGSISVELVDGKGSCADCQAEITYEFKATVIPGGKKQSENTEDMSMEEMPGLGTLPPAGADAGLGGAPPVGAPAPGAAPGGALLQAQASWLMDSRTFIRTASDNFDRTTEKILPPGFICPNCSNREVKQLGNNTFCYACNTVSTRQIVASNKPGKVIAKLRWILK